MGMVIKNRKAVVKTMALILLLFAVTMSAAIVYISVAGSAEARAEFVTDSIDRTNEMQGMKIFYRDMMEYVIIDAIDDSLRAEGKYFEDDFCPAGVNEDDLKDDIYEEAELWITEYEDYKGYSLPPLGTDNLEIEKILNDPGLDYLEVRGYPSEPLKVYGGGIVVSSSGIFNFSFEQTAEEKPEMYVYDLKVGGASTSISIEAMDSTIISARIKNIGCDAAEDVDITLDIDGTEHASYDDVDFDIGEEIAWNVPWTPTEIKAPVKIEVKADGGEDSVYIEVVEPTRTSDYSDACNTNAGDCSNPGGACDGTPHCPENANGEYVARFDKYYVVDCCNWCQDWHVHDLGRTITDTALLRVEFRSGKKHDCYTKGTVYVSSGIGGPWGTSIGQTSETNQGGDPGIGYFTTDNDFRYVKVTDSGNCYNDWSNAEVWVPS